MTATETRAPGTRAWAHPVSARDDRAGAGMDTVTGRRVSGPVQGFGQMWQKTFRVRLVGADVAPEDVIAHWKEQLPDFLAEGSRSMRRSPGSAPGEVALLEMPRRARLAGADVDRRAGHLR